MASHALHFRNGCKFSGVGIFFCFLYSIRWNTTLCFRIFQQHMKKDEDKHSKEHRFLVKAKMLPYDDFFSELTNAVNECAVIYSNIVTDIFFAHKYRGT